MKLTRESSQNLLCEISIQIREKRLSPRRAPGRSLLPLSPKRTQVRLKSLLYLVWLRQIHSEPTDVLRGKSTVCGLNGFLPRLARSRGTFHLNPRPLRALAPAASFRGPLCFASLSAKKYGTPYFSARNRTSKYSRSCSFVAELLSLRKAGPLRFIRVIRRGASAAVGWEGFDCRRIAASFWFAESIISGVVPRTATVSDKAPGRSSHGGTFGCRRCGDRTRLINSPHQR